MSVMPQHSATARCGCGASETITSPMSSTVTLRMDAFNAEHQGCRRIAPPLISESELHDLRVGRGAAIDEVWRSREAMEEACAYIDAHDDGVLKRERCRRVVERLEGHIRESRRLFPKPMHIQQP